MNCKEELLHREITGAVIRAFYVVYNVLGFGFFESIYAAALTHELRKLGHKVAREVHVEVHYDGICLGTQRIDMIVDDVLVVEIKSTAKIPPHSVRQILSYLKSTPLQVGLLLHFGPDPKFYRFVSTKTR